MRELDAVVSEGLTKPALDRVVQVLTSAHSGADKTARLRNKIVPRATYQRSNRFSAQVSETAERLARLYALARSAFADDDDARRFLTEPHPELDGRVPVEVALTEIGGREVEDIIERGLHGLPA